MDGATHGIDRSPWETVVAEADLFLNVSGGTLLRNEYMDCPCKVLIDSDPGWNHFVNFPKWDANPGWQGSNGYRAHDHFFTYAERIGEPDCQLPELGITWLPTRPPVVMDAWTCEPPGETWTTIMTWDNFRRPIETVGKSYGTKELEFAKVESIPQLVPSQFELAVGGASPPVDRWQHLGWRVKDSQEVSNTMNHYQHYIESSRGEFSVAKNVYVATRSGWSSCRSACYLAAGRPVVVQDTGFSEIIPAEKGLLAFSDLDQAIQALNDVESNYKNHQSKAREVAAEYFDSKVVLRDMLNRIGLG
jgi:hypothetical protein